MSTANNEFDFREGEDFLLEPVEEKVADLTLNDANFSLRHRS